MKCLKKFVLISVFFTLILLLTNVSYASDLYLDELNFEVEVNIDGSMDVTETWNIDIEDTNTLYKTFKIDKSRFSEINNVSVKEIASDGNEFEFEEINEEMYHVTKDCYYGLINKKGDFEIAWGVGLDSDSDTRVYEISYTVEDAVKNLKDCSELYWQFVGEDFEVSADSITGTITLPDETNKKSNIKVWGHTEDLNGEIYVTANDKVEFNINRYRSGRYVEVRIAIPEEIYIYSGREDMNKTLQDIINEEQVWAEEANKRRERAILITNIASIIISIVGVIISIFLVKRIKKNYSKSKTLKKFKPTQELEYFRDIPNESTTPAEALYLLQSRTHEFFSTEIGNVFSATLLNLSLKKLISFEVVKNEKNKENITINILNKQGNLEKQDEKECFEFLLKACKQKEGITIKQLEKYITSHSSEVISLKGKIEEEAKKSLILSKKFDFKASEEKAKYELGLAGYIFLLCISVACSIVCGITMAQVVLIGTLSLLLVSIIGIIVNAKLQSKINVYTQKGVDEQEQWKALKKYMEDFSMLDRKEVPEVVLWEKYLVYATAFGIANKVLKQLKVVYPDIENMNNFNSYSYIGIMASTNFGTSFSSSISSAMSASYSSGTGGGGGFSGGGGRRPVDGGGGGGR